MKHIVTTSLRFGQRGFSLIEMLASAIILAVGLLGLASLHFEALKKSNESFYKSIASIQANDLIDRMRSNMDAAEQGFYVTVNRQIPSTHNLNCLGGVANADGLTGGGARQFADSNCDFQQIADQDLFEWTTSVKNLLPTGNAAVCRSSSPGKIGETLTCDNRGNLYVLSITWRDKQGGPQEYRVSFKP